MTTADRHKTNTITNTIENTHMRGGTATATKTTPAPAQKASPTPTTTAVIAVIRARDAQQALGGCIFPSRGIGRNLKDRVDLWPVCCSPRFAFDLLLLCIAGSSRVPTLLACFSHARYSLRKSFSSCPSLVSSSTRFKLPHPALVSLLRLHAPSYGLRSHPNRLLSLCQALCSTSPPPLPHE